MKKTASFCGILLTSILMTSCISTQEMPLAPNVVRIDTQASGLLFTGQAVPRTMRTAAKATLDRGYTHFKFADAGTAQGSVVAGVIGNSNSSFNGIYGRGYLSGHSNTFGTANVVRAPTAAAAATVIMFHANEPGAQGAFDAKKVLQKYSQ